MTFISFSGWHFSWLTQKLPTLSGDLCYLLDKSNLKSSLTSARDLNAKKKLAQIKTVKKDFLARVGPCSHGGDQPSSAPNAVHPSPSPWLELAPRKNQISPSSCSDFPTHKNQMSPFSCSKIFQLFETYQVYFVHCGLLPNHSPCWHRQHRRSFNRHSSLDQTASISPRYP